MHYTYIALGSNVGNRHDHLNTAKLSLQQLPETDLLAFSQIIETAPVGPIEQSPFLNAAAKIETRLTPIDLLEQLEIIEQAAGRPDTDVREKWGPRTLDLDILLYDELILDTPRLQIPHPLMHERLFVVQPLAEIAPDIIHPVLGKTIAELLKTLM